MGDYPRLPETHSCTTKPSQKIPPALSPLGSPPSKILTSFGQRRCGHRPVSFSLSLSRTLLIISLLGLNSFPQNLTIDSDGILLIALILVFPVPPELSLCSLSFPHTHTHQSQQALFFSPDSSAHTFLPHSSIHPFSTFPPVLSSPSPLPSHIYPSQWPLLALSLLESPPPWAPRSLDLPCERRSPALLPSAPSPVRRKNFAAVDNNAT